jgi:hypothetical protein
MAPIRKGRGLVGSEKWYSPKKFWLSAIVWIFCFCIKAKLSTDSIESSFIYSVKMPFRLLNISKYFLKIKTFS